MAAAAESCVRSAAAVSSTRTWVPALLPNGHWFDYRQTKRQETEMGG